MRRAVLVGIAALLSVAAGSGHALAATPESMDAAKKPRLPASCEEQVTLVFDWMDAIETVIGAVGDENDFGAIGSFLDALAAGGSGDAEFAELEAAVDEADSLGAEYLDLPTRRCTRDLEKLRKAAKGSVRRGIDRCHDIDTWAASAALEYLDLISDSEANLFTDWLEALGRGETGDAELTAFDEKLDELVNSVSQVYESEAACLKVLRFG